MNLSGGVLISKSTKKDKDTGADLYIDPDLEDPSDVDEDVTDTSNWEAIRAALGGSTTKKYKLKLTNGVSLVIPYKVCGDEEANEALKGLKPVRDNQKINTKRTKTVKIRRVNIGLLEDWKIVDKEPEKVGYKEIPYKMITVRDMTRLTGAIFPGVFDNITDFEDSDDVDGDEYGDGVSGSGGS